MILLKFVLILLFARCWLLVVLVLWTVFGRLCDECVRRNVMFACCCLCRHGLFLGVGCVILLSMDSVGKFIVCCVILIEISSG